MDRNQVMKGFSGDSISNLPSCVIEHILSYLPMRDVAKTSVLSKEWRHKWLSIPHLVFDQDFESSLPDIRRTESIIYQILLLHNGPIVKFVFNLIDFISDSTLDHWLHFLLNHRVEELQIRSFSSRQPYVMPHYLFSFEHLKCLRLENVKIGCPPGFKGFSRLVRLDLVNVSDVQDKLEAVACRCPMLEFLNIEMFNYEQAPLWCLRIDAPNLKSFHFVGIFLSLSFGNAKLEDVEITYPFWHDLDASSQESIDFFEFFNQLSFIKKLKINHHFVQFLGGVSPSYITVLLPKELSHLTLIQLSTIDFSNVEVVTSILSLVRSSPNLQSLEIQAETSPGGSSMFFINMLVALLRSRVHINPCLKYVTIDCFAGWEAEMLFARLVLSRAPLLRKLEIQCSYDIGTEKRFQLLKEISRFSRASTARLPRITAQSSALLGWSRC